MKLLCQIKLQRTSINPHLLKYQYIKQHTINRVGLDPVSENIFYPINISTVWG